MLASHGAFGLTTFAGNILTMLAIAAATDYGIFIFGRYREARGMGQDRDDGLLHHLQVRRPRHRGFGPDDRRGHVLPEFRAAALLHHHGRPVAIGMIVVVAIAVTLGPAVLFLGSRVGLSNPNGLPGAGFGDESAPPWSAGPHRFSWQACSWC